jgi:hypothetical protein
MNVVPISSLEVPPRYIAWVNLANKANRLVGCERANCISVSLALASFLRDHGLDAQPVRVTTVLHPKDRVGSMLGRGGRRNTPDGWAGHLAVSADGYVFDATLDQVEFAAPLVFPKPEGWDDGKPAYLEDDHGTFIRVTKFHRQNGWKSTIAARRSWWECIYERLWDLETKSEAARSA